VKFLSKILRIILFKSQKLRVLKYQILSSKNIKVIGKPILYQPLLLAGSGALNFFGKVSIGFYPSPFYFNGYAYFDFRRNGGLIEIGNDVWLNNNAVLIADNATIRIGDNTVAGTNLCIYTSDFHQLESKKRMESDYESKDVYIGSNVFLGSSVTILKGVSIGNDSVIGNGSLVIKSIPSKVIAAGVPCKVIRNL
jgi:maltose O-acetyltransferase